MDNLINCTAPNTYCARVEPANLLPGMMVAQVAPRSPITPNGRGKGGGAGACRSRVATPPCDTNSGTPQADKHAHRGLGCG